MSNLLFQGLHLNTSLRESACATGSRSDLGSDTGYSLYDHPHTHRAASIRLASQELSVTKWHIKLALGGEGLIRVTRSADATIILSDVSSSDFIEFFVGLFAGLSREPLPPSPSPRPSPCAEV